MSPSVSVGPIAQGCAYCIKDGLPILPLRYAVARSDLGNAPPLSAPFGAGVKDVALPDKLAHYTLRLLRAGFLYVYDERYGRYGWKGYTVDEGGYMAPFDPLNPPPVNVLKPKEFACSRTGDDPYVARCFTVRDAAKAKRIWLGFSDVLWTPDVVQQHMSEDYRNAHMRCIDIAKMRTGSDQAHARKLDKLSTYVAEYATTPLQLFMQTAPYVRKYLPSPYRTPHQLLANTDDTQLAIKLCSSLISELLPWSLTEPGVEESGRRPSAAWAFSHSPLFADGTRAEAMENWAKLAAMGAAENEGAAELHPGMVALDDPAGMAMELNGLIQQHTAEFTEEPKRKWQHETALTIHMFKRGVKQGVVQQDASHGNSAIYAPTQEQADAILQSMQDDVWDKYADLMQSPTAPDDAIKAWHTAWQQYEQAIGLPALDQSWLAWVGHASFKRYFTHNYDPKSFTCGAVYTEVLGAIVAGLYARPAIARHLTGALNADPTDTEAVFARALGLNDDRLIEPWLKGADAAKTADEGNVLENAINGVYGAWAGIMGANHESRKGLAKYLYQMSRGVLDTLGSRGLETLLNHLPQKRLLTLLGTMAKLDNPHAVLVAMQGTVSEAERARLLNGAIAKVLHSNTGMYRSAAEHIVKDQHVDVQALVLVDEFELMQASADKGGRTLSNAEVARTVSVDTLDAAISRTAAKAADATSEAGIGIVGFFLTAITSQGMLDDVRKARSAGAGAALTRAELNVVAQTSSLTGATFDAASGVMNAYSGWRMGQQFVAESGNTLGMAKWLTGAGKLLGGFGAILGGGMLIWQGADEVGEGHTALGHWDMRAGALTILGGIALLAGWTGIGIVVAVAAGLLMLLIGYFKQNPIQNWIEQTPLGDGQLPPFKGLVPQVMALNHLERA